MRFICFCPPSTYIVVHYFRMASNFQCMMYFFCSCKGIDMFHSFSRFCYNLQDQLLFESCVILNATLRDFHYNATMMQCHSITIPIRLYCGTGLFSKQYIDIFHT